MTDDDWFWKPGWTMAVEKSVYFNSDCSVFLACFFTIQRSSTEIIIWAEEKYTHMKNSFVIYQYVSHVDYPALGAFQRQVETVCSALSELE